MIASLVLAVFDPEQGPRVSFAAPDAALLDFDAASEFLIPKAELCNRLVALAAAGGSEVLGWPVVIESSRYARNALLFNLCFVFAAGCETRPYERIVAKTARVLRDLEVSFGVHVTLRVCDT